MAAISSSRPLAPSPLPVSAMAGRILLLSRDRKTAKTVGRSLELHDFAVQAVDSPGAALEAFAAIPSADLLLVDAVGDGARLAGWMDSLVDGLPGARGGGSGQIVILLLVEADDVPLALEAIEQGAYDYLAMPCSDEQLLVAVRRAVDYKRLRMQNDLFRHHLEQLIAARTNMLEQTMRQLEVSYDVTLEALGNALDLKDAETEGHCKRVTAYTLALGRAMGLTEPQLRVVGRGAFLHDIGKMAIPDSILRKPGKLTAEETEVMRTHSELGYRMVRKIPYLREASEIVYAHQEYFDGTGYPRGLRGEQIHIGARIFALADTLDAITSTRPYRKAAPISTARKEVLRCAGTQFDPAIVDVFVATPDAIWQDLREGIMRDGPEFSPFGYTFGAVG